MSGRAVTRCPRSGESGSANFKWIFRETSIRRHIVSLEVLPSRCTVRMEDLLDFLLKNDFPLVCLSISSSMLHLGITLGPGSSEHYWETAVGKFKAASRNLGEMGLAWLAATMWYSVAVQRLLAYLGSMQEAPGKVLNQERLSLSTSPTVHCAVQHHLLAWALERAACHTFRWQ